MMALSRARDPAVQTVQAWRWRFQDMAARNALAAKVGAGRSSVELFDDAEELALLALAWEPAPRRLRPVQQSCSGRRTPSGSPAGGRRSSRQRAVWSSFDSRSGRRTPTPSATGPQRS